jgi:ribokinase
MAVINIGSMNIDHVYTVEHFVKPGETLHSQRLELHPGGKGLNQSIALAKAGVEVKHAGLIGNGGAYLKEELENYSVNVDWIRDVEGQNGHSMIQVQPDGQNSIVLYGGSNMKFTQAFIDDVLSHAHPEDVVLLQNEINDIPHIIEEAKRHGLRVVFNAAPCTEAAKDYPLHLLDLLIINEVEGAMLSGETNFDAVLETLRQRCPNTGIVLTLGSGGVFFGDKNGIIKVPACTVTNVIDTTSAGDTFTGYMMSQWLKGQPIKDCLELACIASAVCIQRPGSSTSIPFPVDLPTTAGEPEAALA